VVPIPEYATTKSHFAPLDSPADSSIISFMNESDWWDAYGHLNNKIWQYDSFLTHAVRREYLSEMQEYLLKPGGRLLDFGCGAGWFSLPLARQGMAVDGIDSSAEQIHAARAKAEAEGLTNARFWCADRITEHQNDGYDAILLHALVHHIPMEQRQSFLREIAAALVPEGRVYVYDPLAATPDPPWQAWVTDKMMGAVFRLLRGLARVGRLYEPNVAAAMRAGWTMRSPGEQPAALDELLRLLPSELVIDKVSPWHCWSIGYANFCMALKPHWRRRWECVAPLFYRLDGSVRSTNWYAYLRSWPMVSILAHKKAV
jgi:2-polyprenyl-3-methyl-5-hydroxy-6-metoxy-1,4-benzoquinol methylase